MSDLLYKSLSVWEKPFKCVMFVLNIYQFKMSTVLFKIHFYITALICN